MIIRRRTQGFGGTALVLSACLSEPAGIPPASPPVIDAASVAANPHNVLSAIVSVRVRDAHSVAVRFREADAPATADSLTPTIPVIGESATVPVLGLLAGGSYTLRVEVYGVGGTLMSDPLALTTGTLPVDLPRYVAGGSDPSPGFVVFAAGAYGLVIDNTGRVVWYYRFPAGPGLNFQAQPNGRYAARPPGAPGLWIELDPLGNTTRNFGCARGLVARFHDLIAEPAGSYWIMCDETRVMDLTAVGGVANAQVMGTGVQHVSAAGDLLFEWSPFDHFEITDLDAPSRASASVNWTHGNALDIDPDGNLVVSFRSLSEITKIDGRTGAVLWRMGGLRNEFVFEGAPTPAFARQHGVRLTGAGRILLLDNLGDPAGSRAERYVYDEASRTARLVESFVAIPSTVALLGGTTQDLPDARVLVSFGDGRRVQEYDASGQVVWQIEGDPGYVFRAQRIQSLYQPGIGSPR